MIQLTQQFKSPKHIAGIGQFIAQVVREFDATELKKVDQKIRIPELYLSSSYSWK